MGVSAALVAALSLLIAALLAYAAVTRAGPARLLPALAAAGALCSGLFALAHWHRTRRADSWSALRGLWLAHVATLCCAAIVLLPLMNSLQDLSVVAQRLRELSAGRALILWRPDETTVAMVDLYLPRPACIVRGSGTEADRAAALRDCLAGNPRAIVLTQAVADKAAHAEWRAILSGQAGLRPIALPEPSQPLPAGAYQLLGAIQRVGGRAYVLLAPPSSERK